MAIADQLRDIRGYVRGIRPTTAVAASITLLFILDLIGHHYLYQFKALNKDQPWYGPWAPWVDYFLGGLSDLGATLFTVLAVAVLYILFFQRDTLGTIDPDDATYLTQILRYMRQVLPAEAVSQQVLDIGNISAARIAQQSSESHYKAWAYFATSLPRGRPTSHIWATLYKLLLGKEVEQLRNGRVSTTSEVYTEFLSSVCRTLKQEYPTHTVTLHLATAMLPDQFFNWPQVEVMATSQENRLSANIIPHTWTNSTKYFHDMREISKTIKLQRHILVRKDRDVGDLPLCVTSELLEAAKLSIAPYPVPMRAFEKPHWSDVFKQTTGYALLDARQFVRSADFSFYPIAVPDVMDRANQRGRSLFEYFATELHTTVNDALFCEITMEVASYLSSMLTHGKLAAGHLPELAYFQLARVGASYPDIEFAVLSELIPYTEQIDVHLVPSVHMRPQLINMINTLIAWSRPLIDLVPHSDIM